MANNSSTIPFTCAVGDSPEQSITAAATTDLSTLTTNLVHVQNMGPPNPVINNFGGSTNVTYQLRFDQNIVLHHNPPVLTLQAAADRTTASGDRGTYRVDQNGNATEVFYSASNVNTIVATLQAQVATLQAQVATLQAQMAALLAAITPSGTSITVGGSITGGNINGATITGSQLTSTGNVNAGGTVFGVNGSFSGAMNVTGTITSFSGNITCVVGTVSGVAVNAGTSGMSTSTLTASSNIETTGGSLLSLNDVYALFGSGNQVRMTTHTHEYFNGASAQQTAAPTEPS